MTLSVTLVTAQNATRESLARSRPGDVEDHAADGAERHQRQLHPFAAEHLEQPLDRLAELRRALHRHGAGVPATLVGVRAGGAYEVLALLAVGLAVDVAVAVGGAHGATSGQAIWVPSLTTVVRLGTQKASWQ
jgi:hypothetical protein